MSGQILALGALYFLSKGFSLVFSRFRIPDVLLLTFVGILLGPILGILQPEFFGGLGRVATTVALVVILFEGGLGTNMRELTSSLGASMKITWGSFLGTLLIGASFVWLAGSWFGFSSWSLLESLLFGAIIAGTSSAVVIPMLQYLGISPKMNSALTLESALTDVLCIVATVGLLQGLASPEALQIGPLAGKIVSSLFFAILLGIVGGIFWVWVWKRTVAMKTEILTTVAFVLMVYGVAEILGFSGGVAALAFGLTLNNYYLLPDSVLRRIGQNLPQVSSEERSLFREMVFVLKTFFFVYLGVQIPLNDSSVHLVAFCVVALVYFFRWSILRLFLPARDESETRERSLASFLAPKGLAAAVLATLPSQMGLEIGAVIEPLVYAVVVQSIILTSFLVWWTDNKKRKASVWV